MNFLMTVHGIEIRTRLWCYNYKNLTDSKNLVNSHESTWIAMTLPSYCQFKRILAGRLWRC